MSIRIRPLVDRDIAPLASALAPLPLLVRYGRSADLIETDLKGAVSRGDGLLTADDPGETGGGPLGLAWFLRSGGFGLGAYLKLIAVRHGREGGGLGSVLLAAFEAEATRLGRHAFLLVSDFNGAAQAFYERHGWTRSGSLSGLVLPDVTELIYTKRLR